MRFQLKKISEAVSIRTLMAREEVSNGDDRSVSASVTLTTNPSSSSGKNLPTLPDPCLFAN